MAAANSEQPFDISVLYKTVEELKEPIEAKVSGQIPLWLSGSLLRNGPGKFEFGDMSYNHWFDGQALLHRFTIREGKVEYFNKFLRSKTFERNSETQSILFTEYGTNHVPDPCKNIFDRFFSYYITDPISMDDFTDNGFVNICEMKKKFYACSETPIMTEINPDSLEVLNRVDVSKEFPAPDALWSSLAHPHEEPDGTYYTFSATRSRYPKYNILKVPPLSTKSPHEEPLSGGEVLSSVDAHGAESYVHSFGMSDKYIILMENPLFLSVPKVLSRLLFGWSFAECFYWDPSHLSRIHVIDKTTGEKVGVFVTKPVFVFHHVNAFETDDEILFDVVGFDDAQILQKLYLHELRNAASSEKTWDASTEATLRRYRLPLEGLKWSSAEPHFVEDYEVLYDCHLELPSINYGNFNSKPYSFAYALDALSSIIKIDVVNKESRVWGSPGLFASEPVLVSRPGGSKEDDGVILSVVVDIMHMKTFLLVLDAQSMKELGRADVPFTTPIGVHGRFITDMP